MLYLRDPPGSSGISAIFKEFSKGVPFRVPESADLPAFVFHVVLHVASLQTLQGAVAVEPGGPSISCSELACGRLVQLS